jgi:hypothetical protein
MEETALHNAEHHDLYCAPNIMRVTKSRTLAGHVAHTGYWSRTVTEKFRFEDLGVDGRTILKWTFKKYERAWNGFIWPGQQQVLGC